MYAMALSLFGAMLMSWQFASTFPNETSARDGATADVMASNFWSYQKAVVKYMAANPSASGTVADASLPFELGYIRDTSWTHVISNGTLYTYSKSTLPKNVVDAIARRGGRSMTIGLVDPPAPSTSNPRMLKSLTGVSTNFTLPVVSAPNSIPTGGIVVVGA